MSDKTPKNTDQKTEIDVEIDIEVSEEERQKEVKRSSFLKALNKVIESGRKQNPKDS